MLMTDRVKLQKATWELFKTSSLPEAVHKAEELGWADNKVQVKGYQLGISQQGPLMEYIIEPFEKDCGCSNILKYSDYGRIEETLPLVVE